MGSNVLNFLSPKLLFSYPFHDKCAVGNSNGERGVWGRACVCVWGGGGCNGLQQSLGLKYSIWRSNASGTWLGGRLRGGWLEYTDVALDGLKSFCLKQSKSCTESLLCHIVLS